MTPREEQVFRWFYRAFGVCLLAGSLWFSSQLLAVEEERALYALPMILAAVFFGFSSLLDHTVGVVYRFLAFWLKVEAAKCTIILVGCVLFLVFRLSC